MAISKHFHDLYVPAFINIGESRKAPMSLNILVVRKALDNTPLCVTKLFSGSRKYIMDSFCRHIAFSDFATLWKSGDFF